MFGKEDKLAQVGNRLATLETTYMAVASELKGLRK